MTHRVRNSFPDLVVPVLALASSLIAVSGPMAHADTITVCPSGCDYSDLQIAVDAVKKRVHHLHLSQSKFMVF